MSLMNLKFILKFLLPSTLCYTFLAKLEEISLFNPIFFLNVSGLQNFNLSHIESSSFPQSYNFLFFIRMHNSRLLYSCSWALSFFKKLKNIYTYNIYNIYTRAYNVFLVLSISIKKKRNLSGEHPRSRFSADSP